MPGLEKDVGNVGWQVETEKREAAVERWWGWGRAGVETGRWR